MIDDETRDLALAVAAREGWDPAGPAPADHPPRTLAEERAVALLGGAPMDADGPAPRAGRVDPGRRSRLITVALIALVLGVCWFISPERTALALLVAGLMCLVAIRRRSRRDRPRPAARRPALGARRLY